MNNLAELYRAQGRFADAEPLHKRSLKIREEKLGPDHPRVASSLKNLAVLYRALNRHEEAEAFFKRADAIPDPTTKMVRVYFATNRHLEQKEPIVVFGNKRGEHLGFGQANVIVPTKEVVTRTTRLYSGDEPASFAESKLTATSRLIIRKINHISEKKIFAAKLGIVRSRSHRFKNQAVVFVHGFYTSFDDAVSQSAQLCFELEFDGPCLVFTWPSVKSMLGYDTDRKTAEWSVDFLITTLETLAADTPDTKIHVMTHSMGNVLTLQALGPS